MGHFVVLCLLLLILNAVYCICSKVSIEWLEQSHVFLVKGTLWDIYS